MLRWISLAALLLILPFTAGCFRGALALGTGMLVGAAIVASHPPPPPEEVVVYQAPPPVVVVAPQAQPAPPAPPPPPATIRFDANAAREGLENVDLGSCREVGAPVGYGHARVTFAPDGSVTKVAIDAPAGLSGSAVSCIGATLGATRAPRFDGPAASVPTSFYVR